MPNSAYNNDMITAKEIMSEFKISYQIVNHYTNFGLLPVVKKEANIRYYDKNIIKFRIKQIRELMQQGYSLSLIRKKLDQEVLGSTQLSEAVQIQHPKAT